MTLNFIPDGKSKNMSTIESKLDQKQIAGGKTDKAVDEAKEKKKKGGAAEGAAPTEGLSKKEANKLAKKQQVAAAKAALASGEAPPPKPVKGGGPQNSKPKTSGGADKPIEYGTKTKDLTATLNSYETTLSKGPYLNGSQLTSLDKEAYEALKAKADKLSPLTNPHLFGWFCLIGKFNPGMQAKWPVV